MIICQIDWREVGVAFELQCLRNCTLSSFNSVTDLAACTRPLFHARHMSHSVLHNAAAAAARLAFKVYSSIALATSLPSRPIQTVRHRAVNFYGNCPAYSDTAVQSFSANRSS